VALGLPDESGVPVVVSGCARQSREFACALDHITCLMASWPTREKAAVLTAYGFSAKKDLLAQLLELNLAVAQRLEKAEPVTPPGIPATFPNPEALVSDDCIRPPAMSGSPNSGHK
jgi:hypothetical protein